MFVRRVTPALTIEGEVTDESGRFIAGRNVQERQQLVPVLSQIAVLLPRSNSWNSYNKQHRGFLRASVSNILASGSEFVDGNKMTNMSMRV